MLNKLRRNNTSIKSGQWNGEVAAAVKYWAVGKFLYKQTTLEDKTEMFSSDYVTWYLGRTNNIFIIKHGKFDKNRLIASPLF